MTGCQQRQELTEGWQLASTAPGAIAGADALGTAAELGDLAALKWRPVAVPGTVAGALPGLSAAELDGRDWWYRRTLHCAPAAADEQLVLGLDGIATVAEIYLDARLLHARRSMFVRDELELTGLQGDTHELVICCRALATELAVRRRPRARWRTALVDQPNLRFLRTMLLGRTPGFAPGPPVTGIWAPVWLARRCALVGATRIRTRVEADGTGVLKLTLDGRVLGERPLPARIVLRADGPPGCEQPTVSSTAELVRGRAVAGQPDACLRASAELRVPRVRRWWPHTHGEPCRYRVSVSAQWDDGAEIVVHRAQVGFRELSWPADWERSGLALTVNGVAVFARGALWTPLSLTAPHSREPALREALGAVRDAGLNMLRLPGIGCYESEDFYALCDELGIMVWQDVMLANLDYPAGEPEFDRELAAEVDQLLARLGARPSLMVICGGSEVAQQVTLQGLDPALGRGALYTETLPALVEAAAVDAAYVPNAPWGDGLPFRPSTGVANYYGVGAYLRERDDARLADVKFAAECLALANVPEPETLARIGAPGGLSPQHPAWKAGVPRDAGAGWDFDDVRDHYLRALFDVDPVALRATQLERYLELSRLVSGELMAVTFGQWRRTQSSCGGALVLWLHDLAVGAGWGLVDAQGLPKVAYHYLRRALAPVAVWCTDEGLAGVAAHVANDRPRALPVRLRLAVFRDSEVAIEHASRELVLAPHSTLTVDLEDLIGHFVDISYAYRFGPPAHDLVVVSLEAADADADASTVGVAGTETGTETVRVAGTAPAAPTLLSQAFHFPLGLPRGQVSAASLGVEAELLHDCDGRLLLRLRSRRLLYGVRVRGEGIRPADDAFAVEPGGSRTVVLAQRGQHDPANAIYVSAANMSGRIRAQACD